MCSKVQTVAEIHQHEDNDSGHSSSYEGVGATAQDDYLVPISVEMPEEPAPPVPNSPPHNHQSDGRTRLFSNESRTNQGATASPIGAVSNSAYAPNPIPGSQLSQDLNLKAAARPRVNLQRPALGSRVYNASPNTGKAAGNRSPASPLSGNPRFPHPGSVSSEPTSPWSPRSADGPEGASSVFTPLLEGVRPRSGKKRSDMSNVSSGYGSDMSPSEPVPPPDYRAILEGVTETDILC